MSFYIKDVDRYEYSDFYTDKPGGRVFWIDRIDSIGEFMFSFDKQKIYHLFRDYPNALTPEEKAIFHSECPFGMSFLRGRSSLLFNCCQPI